MINTVKISLTMKVDTDNGDVLEIDQYAEGIQAGVFLGWTIIGKNLIAGEVRDFRNNPEHYTENATEELIIDSLKQKMIGSMMMVDKEVIDETIETENRSGNGYFRTKRMPQEEEKRIDFDKYDK